MEDITKFLKQLNIKIDKAQSFFRERAGWLGDRLWFPLFLLLDEVRGRRRRDRRLFDSSRS